MSNNMKKFLIGAVMCLIYGLVIAWMYRKNSSTAIGMLAYTIMLVLSEIKNDIKKLGGK